MKNKITLRFEPAGQTCQTDPHTTIMDAARSLDIHMRTDCGGNGTCGKCRIVVDEPGHFSERTSVEKKHLARAGADPHDRLACQAEIRAAAALRKALLLGHRPVLLHGGSAVVTMGFNRFQYIIWGYPP